MLILNYMLKVEDAATAFSTATIVNVDITKAMPVDFNSELYTSFINDPDVS
jgi:hypothetical protein